MTPILIAICGLTVGLSALLWQRQLQARRESYIRNYALPIGLFEKLRESHPHLSLKDCQLVAQGLRQFFLAHLKSGRKFVSMPSQVVDDLWHEFILHTKNYQQFCRHGFGRFLHHTPAIVLSKGQQGNAGIHRCWVYACHEENINPRQPTRLPLLFALDSKLNVPNGFAYVADCSGVKRRGDDSALIYCGADLGGSAAGCGGGSDGGADSHSSSDSGCGGDGGGGDGCGGGGCGGD
ncbi:MAG: hypothetical protein V4476_23095 [Pseudomonadota bacterium]